MSALKPLRYAFHVISHPFDGFWDLKHEKRGSMPAALTLLALAVATYMLGRQFTAFLFNPFHKSELSVVADLMTVLLLFALWCVSNWCLTSLMDGEGSFYDIVVATAYALTPYILINLPLIAVSYGFSLSESAFFTFFQALAFLWSGGLLVLGTMVTHQYSMLKTLGTTVLILAGMAIIVFLGLLFFSVIQQAISFITIIVKEINLRL